MYSAGTDSSPENTAPVVVHPGFDRIAQLARPDFCKDNQQSCEDQESQSTPSVTTVIPSQSFDPNMTTVAPRGGDLDYEDVGMESSDEGLDKEPGDIAMADIGEQVFEVDSHLLMETLSIQERFVPPQKGRGPDDLQRHCRSHSHSSSETSVAESVESEVEIRPSDAVTRTVRQRKALMKPRQSLDSVQHSPVERMQDISDFLCLDGTYTPGSAVLEEAEFLAVAQRGDLAGVRRSLRLSISPNVICNQGATALHYASYMGHVDVVQNLLANGACADTPIHGTVIHHGRPIQDPTPLRLAAARGNIGVVRLLLEPPLDKRLGYLGSSEPSASLFWALCHGHDEVASQLIKKGARLHIRPHTGHTGPGNTEGFLLLSSQDFRGKVKITAEPSLRFLDEVFRASNDRGTPEVARKDHNLELGQCAQQGGKEVSWPLTVVEVDYSNMRCCIDLGLTHIIYHLMPFFEGCRDASGWALIHYAALSGNPDIMRAMITSGADPNILTPVGSSPLHLVVGPGVISPMDTDTNETIEILLENGAMINAPDQRGYTPLHVASEQHNVSAVSQLLGFQREDTTDTWQLANPDAEDFEGSTPLLLAVKGHSSTLSTAKTVTEHLVSVGAQVNHADQDGVTALHCAVRARNLALAVVLLTVGADCRLLDRDGFTPLHLTLSEPLPDMVSNSGISFFLQKRLPAIHAADAFSTGEEILQTMLAWLDNGDCEAAMKAHGHELLVLAASRDALPAAGALLARGATTTEGQGGDELRSVSLLRMAGSRGCREMVRLILRHETSRVAVPTNCALINGQGLGGEFDEFLRLFEVFLDDSQGSRIVRNEFDAICREKDLREGLYELAKERAFLKLARFLEGKIGIGCCSPAAVFGDRRI